MPSEDDRTAAVWFDMFAHKARVALLRALADGQKTTAALVRLTGLERANAHLHLMKLKRAGLVTSKRLGLESQFKLANFAWTDAGLEFSHPSGAKAVVPLEKPPPPPPSVFITFRKKRDSR